MIRWIFRELRNNRRFSLIFILNLSLGLTGFLCLESFKTSLNSALKVNSKNFLSADIAVESRREITEQELALIHAQLPEGAKESRLLEFFAMVASPKGSRLVQVRAIDMHYPFYGSLTLGNGQQILSATSKSDLEEGSVWVYPELISQLGLQVGEEIGLGQLKFKIADVVTEDSSQTFRLSSLAPRVYMSYEKARESGLLQYGSTRSVAYLYKLQNDSQVPETMEKWKSVIPDPAIRFEDPEEAGEDSVRALQYLSDYLGLASLVALFLASLGTAYLYRSYINARVKSIAILNTLGLSKEQAQKIYVFQLLILGLISGLVSLGLSYSLVPLLTEILKTFAPIDFPILLSSRTVILAFGMGTAGSLLICYPFLLPIRRLQIFQLFQEESQLEFQPSRKDALYFLPALWFYYVLSVWQANSIVVGSYFVASFVGCLILILLFGWLILASLKGYRVFAKNLPWSLRHSLLHLTRRPSVSLAAIVALGLGSLLMNLMPQLKTSLKAEIEAPKNLVLPSLFMFDIQDDQIDQIESFLQSKGFSLQFKSPMVRGRIISVNDQAYEREAELTTLRTREEEAEFRFRNRGVNMSYRGQLSSAEEIVAGQFFTGSWNPNSAEPFEVSVERRYADRLGLKINDILKFDIQGIELTGKITSLRAVKWNSFQPNFFILVQPGVLEEAPKIFLGAVPSMPEKQLAILQDQLVEQFPNVSMVDVGRSVKRIFELSEKMTWSLELMAALSLLAGFVVLFSMAQHQIRERRWDINMLKILGGDQKSTTLSIVGEFMMIGFISSFFGSGLSVVVSYLVTQQIFDGQFQASVFWPMITVFSVTALSGVISFVVSQRVVHERPGVLLHKSS